MTNAVNIVAKDVISVVTAVPRIKGQQYDAADNGNTHSQKPVSVTDVVPLNDGTVAPVIATEEKYKTYYDIISDDADILRIVVQIMNGMSSTATELQKYLSYWDKYKSLWEMDKESYIRKYAKSNNTPAKFDLDITRYKMLGLEINGETTNHVINFVRIDCNSLKDSLIGHCSLTQNKLTGLLNQDGAQELADIFAIFETTRSKLKNSPINLDELR